MTYLQYMLANNGAWGIKFHKIHREVGTPLQEVLHVIDQINVDVDYDSYPVAVLCSGGLDSELWIHLLRRHSKLRVQPIAYQLVYDGKVLNEHDLAYCPDDTIVRSLNLNEFWRSTAFFYHYERFRCSSPQIALHGYMAKLTRLQGYYVVVPEFHPELKVFDDGRVMYEEKEKDHTLVKGNQNLLGLFSPLQSNPYIIYSILTSDAYKKFAANPPSQDSADFKREQYLEWFDVDMKPRPKYHGFEGSEAIDNSIRKMIYDIHGHPDNRIFIPYDTLVSSIETESRVFWSTDPDVHHWSRTGFNPI